MLACGQHLSVINARGQSEVATPMTHFRSVILILSSIGCMLRSSLVCVPYEKQILRLIWLAHDALQMQPILATGVAVIITDYVIILWILKKVRYWEYSHIKPTLCPLQTFCYSPSKTITNQTFSPWSPEISHSNGFPKRVIIFLINSCAFEKFLALNCQKLYANFHQVFFTFLAVFLDPQI